MTDTPIDYSPGTYGCHELLDRCCLISEIVGEFSDHPGMDAHPDWKAKVESAANILCMLYQEIGSVHLQPTDTEEA
jgi:hypothetical protein